MNYAFSQIKFYSKLAKCSGPNNPHPLDWLYDSLSSPPVAGVWWAHWRRCPVAAIASSKWMLVVEERPPSLPPHMFVKRFGIQQYTIKRYINASFNHLFVWLNVTFFK